MTAVEVFDATVRQLRERGEVAMVKRGATWVSVKLPGRDELTLDLDRYPVDADPDPDPEAYALYLVQLASMTETEARELRAASGKARTA